MVAVAVEELPVAISPEVQHILDIRNPIRHRAWRSAARRIEGEGRERNIGGIGAFTH